MNRRRILDRVRAYRVVGVLTLVGAIATGVASFTQSIDTITTFARKYFVGDKHAEPERLTSPTSSGNTVPPSGFSGKTAGGGFAGYNWNFVRDRGLVQLLAEKINLSTHHAEALAWIADKTFSDFDLSATFYLVSGDTSLVFGPVFWLRDERTFYHFALRTAGDYRLVRYRNGTRQELIPWTPFAKVRSVSKRQTVRIVAIRKRVDMFIEGDAVRDYEAQEDETGKVGFYAVDGGLTVELLQMHVAGRELN